ncbi:HU family DNA-binding protein [Streptomyces griseoviridis]|uniref:HU family DNA-binding protein n=1 Tax=Streptomyces griseoviridis TaxID=45398 RepID=UPI0027E55698|nr:HU family DNA-binding protein [Streptomyces niveoruber]
MLDTLVRRVLDGDAVSVTEFGRLQAVHTPARRARNPQTGERVLVPAGRRIVFRPGTAFTAMARGERPSLRPGAAPCARVRRARNAQPASRDHK